METPLWNHDLGEKGLRPTGRNDFSYQNSSVKDFRYISQCLSRNLGLLSNLQIKWDEKKRKANIRKGSKCHCNDLEAFESGGETVQNFEEG
jgi:hypothetical protein